MSQLDIITSLPTSVWCSVLRDWLRLKSVVALDTAYCCKVNRVRFDEVLQSEEYFVREEIWNLKDFSGLSKLGRQMRSMEFDDNLSEA